MMSYFAAMFMIKPGLPLASVRSHKGEPGADTRVTGLAAIIKNDPGFFIGLLKKQSIRGNQV